PHLACLTSLSLYRGSLREGPLQALLGAPFLPRLTALHLPGHFRDQQGLGTLLRSSRLAGLTRLEFSGGLSAAEALSAAELSGLAGSRHLERLATLRLTGIYLSPFALQA